jgi:hypothetical protein
MTSAKKKRFRRAVAVLADEGMDASFLFALRRDCRNVQAAKTKNRRVLGSMKEQAFVSGLWLEERVEGSPAEMVDLARYLNRTILGVIDNDKPIERMREFAR